LARKFSQNVGGDKFGNYATHIALSYSGRWRHRLSRQ